MLRSFICYNIVELIGHTLPIVHPSAGGVAQFFIVNFEELE